MHRIAGSWTHQVDNTDSPVTDWPNGIWGLTSRGPHVFNFTVTSTLNPSLLNEGRFGLNNNRASTTNPWNLSDASIRNRARSFFLQGGPSLSGNGKVYDVLVSPNTGSLTFDGGVMNTGQADISFRNPLYDFADTLSWTHGKHAFKFGADFRFPRSTGTNLQPLPTVSYGNLG